mgnify:CR=1 FL=1
MKLVFFIAIILSLSESVFADVYCLSIYQEKFGFYIKDKNEFVLKNLTSLRNQEDHFAILSLEKSIKGKYEVETYETTNMATGVAVKVTIVKKGVEKRLTLTRFGENEYYGSTFDCFSLIPRLSK